MMKKVRRMRVKRRNPKKWLLTVPAVLMIVATIFLLIDAKVRPMVRTLAVNQAKVLAVSAIDDEVAAMMAEMGEGDFLTISRDGDGRVISVESDSVRMNQVKSQINLAVTERLQSMGEQEIVIPSGSLSGIAMLYGKGAEIHVTLTMTGHSTANITEDFTSGGINQTLHRVLLNISAEVYIALPGYHQSEQISTDFVLSQTVIVGTVPGVYAGIGSTLS